MLTRQEKELLEECLDELYEEYELYQKVQKPGEQLNITFQLFLNIVKKLGLRPPQGVKGAGTSAGRSGGEPAANPASKPAGRSSAKQTGRPSAHKKTHR